MSPIWITGDPMENTIVVLDGYALNPGDLSWSEIEILGKTTVYEHTGPKDVVSRIAGSTLVLTNKTVIGRTEMAQTPTLRYIGVLATGFDIIDIPAAKELGITVCNVPAYSTDSVAQFVFALLLEICHHVGHHSAEVFNGRWTHNRDFCFWDFPGIELKDKTLGIYGFGKIGAAVARIALAFGMEVVAYSRHPDLSLESDHFHFVSCGNLYRSSDIISYHVPSTPQTRNIICAQTISQMRDGVVVINTARGNLVDEKDLAEALSTGKVAAAGLDVLSKEPPSANNPLLSAKNCIITPHIAWASNEARIRCMDITIANIRGFIAGKPQNRVF